MKNKYYSLSNSYEWYTPKYIVDKARKVMGSIDLDPTSSHLANLHLVEANDFFSKEEDCLVRTWYGNVWLNPPYGRAALPIAKKFIIELELDHINSAVLLVKSASDTKWFQTLLGTTHLSAICFLNHRVRFFKPTEDNTAIVQASNITTATTLLLGYKVNQNAFENAYKDLGKVVFV